MVKTQIFKVEIIKRLTVETLICYVLDGLIAEGVCKVNEKQSECISEVVSSIRQIVRSIYLDSKRMVKRFGLTGPQTSVLRLIMRRGPMSSSCMSRLLFVSPSNITGIVDRLEAKSLVKRVRDPKDRRVVVIELTEKGEQTSRKLPDLIEEKLIRGLADMEEAEIAKILWVVQKLVDLMEVGDIADRPLEPDPASWLRE